MNERLYIISSVAEQWLNAIHTNLSTYQQLSQLYNVTTLTLKYQPILHAINTSVVNIIQMLQGSGRLLNVTVNGTDAAVSLLSEILQASDATNYNLSDILMYNISDFLDVVRMELDVVQWFMLHMTNQTAGSDVDPGSYTLHLVTQWIIDNSEPINLIIRNVQLVVNSVNNSLSLTDILHSINETIQIEHLQVLIKQVETVIYNSSGLTFLENLLMNENIQNDTVLALHLLQDINQVNSSLAFTSINNVITILQGLTGIELGYLNQFHNNATVAKVFTIVREGMGILYDIQVKESIDKDMIYRIYNFTYLLVQDEWNWVPFQNISAMEAELLDVWYLAMSPFLGGQGSQAYIGNCTSQDVLNILVQTIFNNGTGNESMVEANCLWQFVNNSSDTGIMTNHTLNEMIYLALQSSPIVHNICTGDSLNPLADEMACLLQLMELSVNVLAGLNNVSGLHIPIVQSLNRSLTFICDDMLEHNTTFQPKVALIQLLDQLFSNQSSPIHFFIQFLMDNTGLNLQTSDLQLRWAQLSKSIKVLSTVHGQFDIRIYKLVELIINVTHVPDFLESWDVLDSFLSMNWTVVEVNESIAILEKLRRAIVLINSGMEAKSIQMYQAVVSLLKTLNITFVLNTQTPSGINLKSSSFIQCDTALKAIIQFSDSVWATFDSQHSHLQEELVGNVSSLACDLLNYQSLTYNWNNMAQIQHILPYIANYLPVEMTNYFTAAEKIISFMLNIPSSTISQENILNGAFKLLIQELRLFNNTSSIADWLEIIPVRSFYSLLNDIIINLGVSIPSKQTTTEQIDVLLNVLADALNAPTYPQALSSISQLLTLLPSNFSGMNNITQEILSLTKELTVDVQNVSLPEPYGIILNCLNNATQGLVNAPSGHLQDVIQLIQDVFTQSNESANTSMILGQLKQKIYKLQNLTSVLCEFSSSTSCVLACQYHTLLKNTLQLVVTGIQNITTAASTTTSSLIMTTVTEKLWQFVQDLLSSVFNSVIPFQDLQLVSEQLSSLTELVGLPNVTTSPDIKVTIGNIFGNNITVMNALSQVVKLNQSSIQSLMEVPIPDNMTQILSWIVQLSQCHSNLSLVPGSLQEFCDLSPTQGYQMAIIFLQNVDVTKLLYKLILPASWETNIDYLLTVLSKLIDQFGLVTLRTKDIYTMISITNLLKSSSTTTRKNYQFMTRSQSTGSASFMDISNYICTKNYTMLGEAFSSLVPMVKMSRQATQRAQSLSSIYGIPSQNTFCSELFLNLVQSSSGAAYWILLKPLLYGKILYTPNTTDTQTIMDTTNTILQDMKGYRDLMNTTYTSINMLMKLWPLLDQAQSLINVMQNLLNKPFVSAIIANILNTTTTELLGKVNQTAELITLLNGTMNEIDTFGNYAYVLSNLLSCMEYDRMQPKNNVTDMMAEAYTLQKTNELFAAVTFDLPSESNSTKRNTPGTLPKQVKYSISMRSLLSEDTSSIKDLYWTPGPHNSGNKYSRGFVYLQENIERAIIKIQTNKTLDDIGAQFQPMPYPCYNKDSWLYSMSFSLPIALMITWVLFVAAFVKKLVHEKELRLHEYMKMMGINSFSHFFAWLIESTLFLIVTVSILVLILKFGKILPNSNGFILFLFFLDYSLTVISMSYLISVFFHNTNIAALSGSLIYIIAFFPYIVVASKENFLSMAGKTLLCIFSPTALSYGTQYIVYYEEQDTGIQWNNMYKSPVLNDTFNCAWTCWMMLIDSFIYFIVGAYIRTVFPGMYGIGAVWYFPFLPSFWLESCGLAHLCPKKVSGLKFTNMMVQSGSQKKGGDNNLSPNNEMEPSDLNVGISLHGLTKTYNSKMAVKDLNLTFYEGHITAILGHNGAGKTTTLSMLTGLFSATSGTIYIYGEDIRTHLNRARKSMGVCMQYDVLFDHLTTKEHLLLYGSIKAPQWDRNQLHMEVKRTLKDTGLYSHRHKPVRTLSGGMRRKLSISIALIGGSKVVILDEPTTGVDPCSRRGIWEVISKNKTDKTIILSTHHLDEAEVLSDRIAFLEQGGLKCCGSPLFLKERFGSGYHLTLTKKFPDREDNRQCDSEMVTSLIQSHIPEAKLKEDVGGELVYVLPPFRAEISSAYLSLLRALDTKMSDLQIGCYGISDTTIEEVFLKLIEGVVDDDEAATHQSIPISNIDNLIVQDETSSTSYSFPDRDDQSLTKSEKLTGLTLTFKKIMAIFIKRFHNSRRNWKGLISQILLPVLFVIAAMGLGSLSSSTANYPEILLSPNLYGTDQAVPFWIHNRSSEDLMSAMSSPPGIDNSCINNKAGCLNETSLGQWISTGNQTSQYGTCNCSSGLMVCDAPDSQPPHRLTYSKQMLYNVTDYNIEKYLLTTTLDFIQQRYGGWSFGIPLSTDALLNIVAPPSDNKTLSTIWYNPEGTHSLPAYLNSFNNFLLRANLPTNESEEYGIFVSTKPLTGTVSQQSTAATLVNTLVALSILAGYSITTASFVTYIVKEHHNGSKRLQHIAGVGEVCYWLTNFLYDLIIYLIPVALSIAMIAVFKLPAFYEFPNLGAVSILFILFGYATFPWMYLISGVFKNPGMAFIVYVCINLFIGINTIISSSLVYFLVQQQSSSNTSESLSATYNTLTSVFQVFPQFCFGYGLIQLSQQQVIQNQLSLYGNEETVDVFSMDILGWMFTAMAIQGTFCLLVRLFINDGIIYSIKSFVKRTCLKSYQVSVKTPDEDEDVMTERDRVESGNAEGDLLQLKSLTKIFHHVNKKMIAVNNMSLGIPPGECFGLLGVNGAGKTTTFKMLTGDISPSFGNIQVRDNTGKLVNVLGYNTDWSSFGYCPQDDALDELMTGEEHLYYYARIHGIPEKHIKSASNRLLHKMHLTQYKDRVTGNYSCGTRRKLSTALALVGRPSILLLDEPSSGMDPKTKRHLWKIISEEVKDRCAVVLTSHSMEECEALCTRLAIMVKGKFQCIGSLQHIKSRFGSGFTVKMHLKDSSVSVEIITSFMHSHFPNTYLKDQHFTMVEYHVPVSAGGVASIFDLMESNKANLNIIHFSVSQTTLDEVFINFAQSQETPDNSSLRSQEFNQVVIT
ncbi:glucosylceramide transporter ABCA12-like [Pelodytes ibericus]